MGNGISSPQARSDVAPRNYLKKLMENEDIAHRIFLLLIDTDLLECRRVCRQWRNICNQLPLKVKLSFCSEISEKALRSYKSEPESKQDSSNQSPSSYEAQSIVHLLNSMPHLTHLTLSGVENIEVVTAIQSLKQLRSLNVRQSPVVFRSLSLDQFPQLTALSTMDPEFKLSEHPALSSRLKRLQVIATSLPPSKTNLVMGQLTQLHVLDDIRRSRPFATFFGDAFDIWGVPNLVNLVLETPVGLNMMTTSRCLENFSSLESLEVRNMEIVSDDFFQKLLSLKKLKALSLLSIRIRTLNVSFGSLTALNGLESLVLSDVGCRQWVQWTCCPSLSSFTGLTKLRILSEMSGDQYLEIEGLRDLQIVLRSPSEEAHLAGLSKLSNLESLSLDSISRVDPNWIAPLKKLKRYKDRCETVHEDLVSTLSKMTGLTDLDLPCMFERSEVFHKETSQLSNLVRLKVRNFVCEQQKGYMCLANGGLNHLRYLSLIGYALKKGEEEILKRKLPSLRKLSVHGMNLGIVELINEE